MNRFYDLACIDAAQRVAKLMGSLEQMKLWSEPFTALVDELVAANLPVSATFDPHESFCNVAIEIYTLSDAQHKALPAFWQRHALVEQTTDAYEWETQRGNAVTLLCHATLDGFAIRLRLPAAREEKVHGRPTPTVDRD